MSQMLHIMRKDARRLRWLLALWLALLAARTVMVVNGAVVGDNSVATGLFVQQMWVTMAAVELLVAAAIAAQLVLDEPLVGFTPFWLTRPYDPGSLLKEKLLVSAVVMIVLPTTADLVTLSLFDADASALIRAGAVSVLVYASWALLLMVLAVLAPSTSAFAVIALGVATAGALSVAMWVGFVELRVTDMPGYTPFEPRDTTPQVVMMLTYLSAGLLVVIYQYRQRRRHVAAWLAIAGLVATSVVPRIWPFSFPFAQAEPIRAGAWAADASIGHDPSWGTKVTEVTNVSRQLRNAWRRLNAHLTVSGVPRRITVQSLGIRSRLQFADGVVVESSQSAPWGDPFIDYRAAAELLGARILTTYDLSEEQERWTPMVTLTERQFLPLRGRTGRLEATIDLISNQARELGRLPLTPGASLEAGTSRIEIAAVQRLTDGRTVVVRRMTADSPFSTTFAPPWAQSFALHRRSTGEALMGGGGNRWEVTSRPNVADVGGIGAIPRLLRASGGFSVETLYLRFIGGELGRAPLLEPSWFDDAELVVLQRESAGVVSKRLVIENFAIPPN
jgi:hypothetical protein